MYGCTQNLKNIAERIHAWRMRVKRDAAPLWNSTSRGLAATPEFLFEPLFAAR
jgi:hypothetical protein